MQMPTTTAVEAEIITETILVTLKSEHGKSELVIDKEQHRLGRDPGGQVENLGDHVIAFYYYDIIVVTVMIDGEWVVTKSEPRNHSKTYYINARVITLAEAGQWPDMVLANHMTAH